MLLRSWRIRRLIRKLGDRDPAKRVESARKLSDLGEPVWQTRVKGDDSDFERLGKSGDPIAVIPLLSSIRLKTSEAIRFAVSQSLLNETFLRTVRLAASALGELGDRRATIPLVRVLFVEYEGIGFDLLGPAEVPKALAKLRDPRCVMPLIALLKLDSAKSRIAAGAAAWVLGEMRDSRALEPLVKLAGFDDFKLASVAVKSLGRLGDTGAIDPLIWILEHERDVAERFARNPLHRAYAHYAAATAYQKPVGSIDQARGFLLAANLADSGPETRRFLAAAASALGDIGDPRAILPLTTLTTAGDEVLRKTAQEAINKIRVARVSTPSHS